MAAFVCSNQGGDRLSSAYLKGVLKIRRILLWSPEVAGRYNGHRVLKKALSEHGVEQVNLSFGNPLRR